jgi:hypothetical protein
LQCSIDCQNTITITISNGGPHRGNFCRMLFYLPPGKDRKKLLNIVAVKSKGIP